MFQNTNQIGWNGVPILRQTHLNGNIWNQQPLVENSM